MKRILTRIKLCCVLALSGLLVAPLMSVRATAPPAHQPAQAPTPFSARLQTDADAPQRKVAPDLEDDINEVALSRRDKKVGVIIQLRAATPLSEEGATEELIGEERDRLFARDVDANAIRTPVMRARIESLKGRFKRSLNHLGLITAEMPLSKVRDLEGDPEVAYISPDREVASAGHVDDTVGGESSDLQAAVTSGVAPDGTGVGVAVLDSGIDDTHNVIKATATHRGLAYAKSFTSAPANRDAYGHGTHVGTILFGDPGYKSAAYAGIAYDANILSLAVLDGQGKGQSSTVVTAIDWCVTNKIAYNIRIINMSFGAAPKDSYTTDPLCLAARRAHNAGIVVIAAAGNNGKDSQGRKIYGGINSPGIEPSVITVGALNTYGTDLRGDDVVATYSSRGPTRGYKVVNNVKKYDNLIKPDIVAPGNKLIGACSPSSINQSNSLVAQNPSLKCGAAATTADQMMYLSGTSMAAPVVTGAAALLLQINPTLTPSLVKAILMYTAQPMRGVNTYEQGAGRLNVAGAAFIASRVVWNVDQVTTVGATILTQPITSSQYNWIMGSEQVYWGQGVITNYGFLYGSDLINKWQAVYAPGKMLADATTYSGSTLVRSTTLTTSATLLYKGTITNSGVLLSDGTLLSDSTLLADGTLLAGGTLLADGTLLSDGTLLADGNATSMALAGDNTACMQPAR